MTEPFDLVRARVNAGLTQRDLAARIGVNRDVIRRLEAGLGVRPATAKKVADHFEVQVADLMPIRHDAGAAA